MRQNYGSLEERAINSNQCNARPPTFRTRASLEQARVVGRVGVGVVHGIISLQTRRPLDRTQKQHREFRDSRLWRVPLTLTISLTVWRFTRREDAQAGGTFVAQ